MYAEASASERKFLPPAVAVSVIAFALRPPQGAAVDSAHADGVGGGASTLWLPLVRRTREPFRGRWALPGGPTRWDETLSDTALRTSRWAVRREPSYLEQLYSFGGVERSAEAQRLVTIAYWALFSEDLLTGGDRATEAEVGPRSGNRAGTGREADAGADPRPGASAFGNAPTGGAARIGAPRPSRWDDPEPTTEEHRDPELSEACWFSADALPELAFDHERIVATAVERLRSRTEYAAIAHHFLGTEFTLARLRSVHEAVRGHAVDPANFRRQTLARGLLIESGGVETGGTGRPAKLYRFREGPAQGDLDSPDPSLTRSAP